MKYLNKRKLISLTLLPVVAFLGACASPTKTPTANDVTATIVSTKEPTTPAPANTVEPSETLNPYTTEIYPDSLFTLKLSEVTLKIGDIPQNNPDYPFLNHPSETDLTEEIADTCNQDCVKIVWNSKEGNGISPKKIIILMIRTQTAKEAAEKVTSFWNEFSQVKSGTYFNNGPIYFQDLLPKNSLVGIKAYEPNVQTIFVASRGPVFMQFIYEFQASGDLVLNYASIQHLAKLQINKLEFAGYPK